MRNRKIFFILIGALLAGVFHSCKKYRDDDTISFKRPVKRIEGAWQIKKYLINYQDSSYNLYPHSSAFGNYYYFKDVQLIFHVDKMGSSNNYYWIEDGPNNSATSNPNKITIQGSWQFDSPYEEISIAGSFDFQYRVPNNFRWKIIKLSNNEFIIKTNYNSKEYEIIFSKI